ncbi:hypothetical protein [Kaarinaea lacus]
MGYTIKKYKKYSSLSAFLLLVFYFFIPLSCVYAGEALQTQNVNKVSFELMECQLSGKSVRCIAFATSGDRDRGLKLAGYGNSKMYDDAGNEYQPTTLHIANKDGPNSHGIGGLLISGVRTKLQLVFDNVSTDARSVSRLDFKGKVDNKPLLVTFRNIPITN